MHVPRRLCAAFAVAALASVVLASTAQAAGDKIVVARGGTASFAGKGGSTGTEPTSPTRELRGPKRTGSSPLMSNQLSSGPDLQGGNGRPVTARPRAKSTPNILLDWEGVNHRDSRFADGGNQFSGEPPDQGLCVGNGYVLETVNSALRVYDSNTGAPVTPVLSLNEFYGLPPAIDRSTFTFGPFTFDISCHYDPDTNRWIHLAVDLDQDPETGNFTGRNYLDLAVSNSGDPTGSWTIYRIPGINDGSEGTPDHDCEGGPCFADFPHLGVDKHGVYITTNEFPLFADGFIGAQVYAISKRQLVAAAPSIDVHLFNTADDPVRDGEPGFTLWPALSAKRQFDLNASGTEYFVSSNAVFDDANADSEELILWALVNTKSLDSPAPDLALHKTILDVDRYAVPSNSAQKPGTIPLADCLNDTNLSFFNVLNCGMALLGLPPQNVTIGTIDTGDSRVLDVRYANHKLWAVLGTAAQVDGENRTAVGWYIIEPTSTPSGVSGSVEMEGVLASSGESLTYPALAVTANGRGLIGFSIVGENTFPSAGYAPIDDRVGVGEVHVAEAGKSPQDGFTEYPPVGGNRPRWGDYSAGAVDGNHLYFATEYIEQPPCTLEDYIATNFSCFGTRSSLANWSTRVVKLKP